MYLSIYLFVYGQEGNFITDNRSFRKKKDNETAQVRQSQDHTPMW